MFIKVNLNPKNKIVGDCVIRAISFIVKQPWDKTYTEICNKGFEIKDMPSANNVWGSYLRDIGYKRYIIPNTCPDCYTVRDFCHDHRQGRYILATGSHVIASVDGCYYDTWDSGDETPIYFWRKD